MSGSNQYNRPGARYYVNAATRQRNHGDPCVEDNMVGVAQKQKQPSSTIALASYKVIAVGESHVIINKGVVRVPFVAGAVKGSTVWINITNDAITLTDPGAGNGRKFGRVVEIAGQRATETGFMRVDLDAKDSF
jgi:hypothetical protein